MQTMNEGMQLDPQTMNNVLLEKIGQAAIREAQLEAGIQQLLQDQENQAQVIAALKAAAEEAAEGAELPHDH